MPGAYGPGVHESLTATRRLATSGRHSEKQQASPALQANIRLSPAAGLSGDTGPLAGMLRAVSAGSNTAAVHLAVLDEVIAAIRATPPIDGHYRRRERRWRSLRDARESLRSGSAQGPVMTRTAERRSRTT